MPTKVTESEESAETWAAKAVVPHDLREAIAHAQILLVPTEGYGDRQDLVFFPAGTSELFRFLKDRTASDINIEVAATDDSYCEVARHADVMYLTAFLLNAVLAPIFARLLSEYILMRVGRHKSSTKIKTSVTLRDDVTQRSARLDYEGSATAFSDAVVTVAKQLQSGEALTTPDDSIGYPELDHSVPSEVPR